MRFRAFGILVAAAICGVGCAGAGAVAEGRRDASPTEVLEQCLATRLQWPGLSMKVDATVRTDSLDQSFTATVRMVPDSAVWMSLSPALGVEVARLLLTRDSLFVLSKIPGNRWYYAGPADVRHFVDADLGLRDVQDLLSGRPLGLDPEGDKFLIRNDGGDYVLVARYPRKARRVVGAPERAVVDEDSLGVTLPDRRYARVRGRADADDLLVKRHRIDAATFDPVRDDFDDFREELYIAVERSAFVDTEQGRYPRSLAFRVDYRDAEMEIELEIQRIKVDTVREIPFEVPEDVERRSSF